MLFKKKPKNSSIEFKTAVYTPSKLSQEALDAFVEKYNHPPTALTTIPYDTIPYVTKSGQTVIFSPGLVHLTRNGGEEFLYLLAQTLPFHKTDTIASFSISELAYIMGEDGKPVRWAKEAKVLTQFVTIGNSLSYIRLEREGNDITFIRRPGTKAIIHHD